MPLTIGLKGRAESFVTEQNTAAAVGSGSLAVFATPMMAALMEAAAVNALEGYLEEGEVLSREISAAEQDGNLVVTLSAECREQIGRFVDAP